MRSTRRTPAALAVVALLALFGVGCGAGSTEDGTPPVGTAPAKPGGGGKAASAHAQAVRFAECMRDNGVSGFPDPDASGSLTIDGVVNGSSLDPESAAFKQAINACKHLEPPGFTGTKATPPQMSARLGFARCVRAHGVKDFPDPTRDGALVDTDRIPSSATKGGMSILNAAMRACQSYASKAGIGPGT